MQKACERRSCTVVCMACVQSSEVEHDMSTIGVASLTLNRSLHLLMQIRHGAGARDY